MKNPEEHSEAPPLAADAPSAERLRAGLLGLGGAKPPEARPSGIDVEGPVLRRELEASLREVMHVDRADGAGAGPRDWLKRLIVRLSRPFSGRQAAFNERLLAALVEVGHRSQATDRQLANEITRAAADRQAAREEARLQVQQAAEAMQRELPPLRAELAALADSVDTQVCMAVDKRLAEAEHRLREMLGAWLRDDLLHQAHETMAREQATIDAKLRALLSEQNAAVRHLIAEAARLRAESPTPAETRPPASPERLLEDLSYFHFELKMRGDPASVRERQSHYVALLGEALGGIGGKRLLDLGGGSGLFAALARENGAEAEAIDLNAVAVAAGGEQGRPTREADLFADLRARPAASLDAVTAFQVVEHLPEAALRVLFAEARRVLRPGGIVLFETLNPRSLSAFRWYFMDLSHVHFLQPEALEHLADSAGLVEIVTVETTPPPAWERLAVPPEADATTARNIELLNRLLYGPMEYYLTARSPSE